MSVWLTTSVEDVPAIELVRWAVIEVSSPKDGNKDHHFVGYNVTEQEGRVSSKIVSFDAETRIGVTRSGRKYLLSGNPGMDSDAGYVLLRWLNIYGVSDYVDVTDQYIPQKGDTK